MFRLQLRGELLGSMAEVRRPLPVNPDADTLALLEARKGYGQFRVTLPDQVTWSEKAALIHGRPGVTQLTLEEAIRSYLPDDRKSIVDTFTAALEQQRGFRFVARCETPAGQIRMVECMGDVMRERGKVTGSFGVLRDVTKGIEREALSISRARLIGRMIDNVPVPMVVLDRALRVVSCSDDWIRCYGIADQDTAIGEPLGRLIDVNGECTAALIEALAGRTSHITLTFYAADDRQPVLRPCAVIPWQRGSESSGGAMMVLGSGTTSFASREIADRTLGGAWHSLLDTLATLSGDSN